MESYDITKDGFNKLASAYQDKFMDIELYNDSYDLFCEFLGTQNATVLDVGCGPGNITRYLLSDRPDLKITGIDVAPNMVELAKTNNPTAHFKVMDCRDITQLGKSFDGIICGFCVPYLSAPDLEQLAKDCNSLLNPGGVYYISAIEGDYSNSGYDSSSSGEARAFVYYYKEDFLRSVLEGSGFDVRHTLKKTYQKTETETSTHLISIATKRCLVNM